MAKENLLDHELGLTMNFNPPEGMVGHIRMEDLADASVPTEITLEPFQKASLVRVSGGRFTKFGVLDQERSGLIGEYFLRSISSLQRPNPLHEVIAKWQIRVDRSISFIRLINRGNGWNIETSSDPYNLENLINHRVYMEHKDYTFYPSELEFTEEHSTNKATYPVLEYIRIVDNLPYYDPNSGLLRLS